jgi:LPS-assembly lipoprotein
MNRNIFAASALFAACLFLAACGFQPMYGDKGDAATNVNYSAVDIENIPDRNGQYLRNQLIDRLYLNGRPAETLYTLKVASLKTVTTNLGIRKDASSTRAMAEVDTTIQLVEKATNKVLLQRDVRATGGYNELDNQFATIVSRQSVEEHMLEELADDIVTELGLYFHRAGSTSPAELPVSIAKPTRSPAEPISGTAVPKSESAPKSDIVPVTP